jgi:hypothetical protein
LSADEFRRMRVLKGKVLVQQEDGSFDWKKRGGRISSRRNWNSTTVSDKRIQICQTKKILAP